MNIRRLAAGWVGWGAVAVVVQFAEGGTVRYVSPSGAELGGHTNWATAAKTVEKAVNACNHGDIIWVSNGVTSVSSQVAGTNGSPAPLSAGRCQTA